MFNLKNFPLLDIFLYLSTIIIFVFLEPSLSTMDEIGIVVWPVIILFFTGLYAAILLTRKHKKSFYASIAILILFILFVFTPQRVGGSAYYRIGWSSIYTHRTSDHSDFGAFSRYIKVEDADPFSFKAITDEAKGNNGYAVYYAKDKNNIYTGIKKLEGVDPETFEISGIYAKDKHRVFCLESGIPREMNSADPKTFEYLELSHAKDKNHAFWVNEIIDLADPITFEVINYDYAKDKNYVFWRNKVVELADPITFEIVNDEYSKDKDHVFLNDFYETKILSGADPSLYNRSKLEGLSGRYTENLIDTEEKINKNDNDFSPGDLKLCFNDQTEFSIERCLPYVVKNMNPNFSKSEIKSACEDLDEILLKQCLDDVCEVKKIGDPTANFSKTFARINCLEAVDYYKITE